MTRESRNFNKRIEEQSRIETFPDRFKVMCAASLLIGAVIAFFFLIAILRITL